MLLNPSQMLQTAKGSQPGPWVLVVPNTIKATDEIHRWLWGTIDRLPGAPGMEGTQNPGTKDKYLASVTLTPMCTLGTTYTPLSAAGTSPGLRVHHSKTW